MTPTVQQPTAAKQAARAAWAAGNDDATAQALWPAGARVVQAT